MRLVTVFLQALSVKSGLSSDPPVSQLVKTLTTVPSSVWTVVATIRSFCALPEVRLLASQCLEKWLVNPALVDQVKLLLQSITENVATDDDVDDDIDTYSGGREGEVSTRTGASSDSTRTGASAVSTRTRASCGRLIASDMQVVREIVRMRSRLKASQTEMHRHAVIGCFQLFYLFDLLIYPPKLPTFASSHRSLAFYSHPLPLHPPSLTHHPSPTIPRLLTLSIQRWRRKVVQ